jgi:hypothetical protein
MSTASPLSEAIRGALTQPTGGISGLVDDLLTVCRVHGLQLDWRMDRCRVRSFAEDWHALPDLPLRKSVFRAILARLATLCNEQRPGSCSPYGGKGEITVGTNAVTVFRVDFTNTPDEQRLQLTHDRRAKAVGGDIMLAPLANQGDPMLAALLAQVPRLRGELPGWTLGHLVPALGEFRGDATDAQIATALSNLRKVLRERADIDAWLGDIADLGVGEFAGPPMAMTPDNQLPQHIPLPPDRSSNRTIVEQARALGEALTPTPTKAKNRSTPPSQSRPEAK